LRVTADDRCTVWVNGQEVGTPGNWRQFRDFNGFAQHLRPGKNIVAVRAENLKAEVPKNPAGLVLGMSVGLQNGKRVEIETDDSWRTSREEASGWRAVDFDDHAWQPAKVVAKYGDAPWG